MTKMLGVECFICGGKFNYGTTSTASVDHNVYGGYICQVCKAKGAEDYLYWLRKDFDDNKTKATLNLAKRLVLYSSYKGERWSKGSDYHRACRAELEYVLGGYGIKLDLDKMTEYNL